MKATTKSSDLDDISLINSQLNETSNSFKSSNGNKYLSVTSSSNNNHLFNIHHHNNHQHNLSSHDFSPDLFLQYVRENNLNLVRELLVKHKTNAYSPYNTVTGATNAKDLLSATARHRIDLEIHDEAKQTPLLIATRFDYHDIACLLIEYEAKINKSDADSWTPLLNACRNGNVQLVDLLLKHKAQIEDRDIGGFTPLMWACYKNHLDIVKLLLQHGANPNSLCKNSICCLSWAAGRGHVEIVNELLKIPTIKVNQQDLNSSTPLLWAARKGSIEIVKMLLEKKANTELIGMNNMTPLIIACKNNHKDVALHLSNLTTANLNHVDKDGNSALTISVKQGHTDVVMSLLSRGAYVNTPNKKGDNILITAVKGGHKQIIDALLDKHVEIDAIGNQGKTAMHHSVEKGNLDLVRALLAYKPDLEITTKDGDTVLLLAVKKKSAIIVNELLNHGSKVSPTDKNGDNVLHISLRNRSREITELILANPKNSKYLYRPNKHGDTPHKIDASNPKSILAQIFGARQLNMSEDGILGYDLYSSALAEILSEPSLNTPITVGLYAKWGSGKSFLLAQLKSEMKSFAKLTRIVSLKINLFLIFSILFMNLILTIPFCFWNIYYGLILFGCLTFFSFFTIFTSMYFFRRKEKDWAERACQRISSQLNRFKLLLRILFLNPNDYKNKEHNLEHKTLRFIFTEYGKISTIGGESAFAIMIGSLYDKLEDEFGTIITRLCRSFYNKSHHSHSKFRRVCCIPTFLIIIILVLMILSLALFFRIKNINLIRDGLNVQEQAFVATFGFIILISIFSSSFTWMKIFWNLIRSPKQTIIKSAQSRDKKRYHNTNQDNRVESFIFKLKHEVDLIAHTVRTIDIFNHSCTRLVVIIDGLDSCEQSKVLQILEIIHVLFTRESDPFVNILAVDPHVLIKGIEGNLTAVFRNGNVNGHDYLRTIIHLPVYLQVDLSKAKALSKEQNLFRPNNNNGGKNSIIGSSLDMLNKIESTNHKDKKLKKRRRSVKPMSAYDLTDQLIKSDYFLDVNPRNLRRLINIIALTGRLLRAYHIDFNWRVLASWIYLSEQWPYRCSWIIMYLEEHELELSEETNINEIYKLVKTQIPITNEPLLELDRSPRKFEQFLENSQPNLNVGVLKKLLPCTCNLDPLLIKLIKDSCDAINDSVLYRNNLISFDTNSNINNVLINPNNSVSSLSNHQNFVHFNGNGVSYGNMNNHHHHNHHHPINSFSDFNNINNGSFSRKLFDVQTLSENHYMNSSNSLALHKTSTNIKGSNLNDIKNSNLQDDLCQSLTVNIDFAKLLPEMSLDDICDAIKMSIDYMSDDFKLVYVSLIKEKNINGKVLAFCDLNELKSELNMSFGDWQLFKSWILENRLIFSKHKQQQKQLKPKNNVHTDKKTNNATTTSDVIQQPLIVITEPINSVSSSSQRKVEFTITPVKEDDLIINSKKQLASQPQAVIASASNDLKSTNINFSTIDYPSTVTMTETLEAELMIDKKDDLNNKKGLFHSKNEEKITKKQEIENITGFSDNYFDNSSSITPLISIISPISNNKNDNKNNESQYDYYYEEEEDDDDSDNEARSKNQELKNEKMSRNRNREASVASSASNKLQTITKNLLTKITTKKSRRDSENSNKSQNNNNSVFELVSSSNQIGMSSDSSSRKHSLTKQNSLLNSNSDKKENNNTTIINAESNKEVASSTCFIIDDEEEDIF